MATKKARPRPKPRPQAKKAKPPRKAKPARAAAPKKSPLKPRPPAPSARPMGRGAGETAAMPSRSTIRSSLPLSSAPSRNIPTLSGASQTNGGTRYLTVQDLVDLHRAVSVEFGGTQAHPGMVDSQFGLINAVQRPQVTTLGREAYPSFPDKVAAFLFALLTHSPFRGGNRRVALASLFAFCELNNRTIDSRVLDEKTAETLFKRAAAHREMGIAPENVFREIREILVRAIVAV
ncbi:MAG: hypothetical protein DMF58_05600 [Acidobacteria bacterium]|nr:MAG: hypothetical protein DMF58_05600 [Acidobacteriota bacterium]